MNLSNLKSKPKDDGQPGITLIPGAYICKIVNAEVDEVNKKVKLYIDIAKGQLTGYFKAFNERKGYWNNGGIFVRKVQDGEFLAESYKRLVEDLEHSNPTFEYDTDNVTADTFIGLYCGFIFGEEEYIDKFGNLRSVVKAKFNISTQKVKDGKFKIPPKQTVKKPDDALTKAQDIFQAAGVDAVDDNDVPF